MAVRFDGLIILLLFFVNFVTLNPNTSFPKDDESLLDGGPRESLNETGRYLYTHPITNKGNLLCKKCSDKALQDDTYSFHQQPACINKNYNRSGSDQTAPYCNKGEDLGCGQVPFNHTNSHWECNTGYSDKIHTVYSTCRLICNISQTTIGKIYCSEALNWYVDLMPEEQCGDVRGERSLDTSPIQPLAHVRLGTNVRREQGTSHAGNGKDLSMVPRPHGDRLDEPIGDMNEMNEGGAMGGEGMVPGYGQRAQILTKGIDDRFNCKTPLQDLRDCICIEKLCHRANPRKLHGDKKSWFGLGLCYELETHFLYALEHAKSGEVNHGPMYHLMKVALPQSFTIGHVVWYFTQRDSYNKEIVDLLIDRCRDHVNCDYCECLRRNSYPYTWTCYLYQHTSHMNVEEIGDGEQWSGVPFY